MELMDAINQRRATRSLKKVDISDEDVTKLAEAANLAPSCFNNQPWNFVFVRDDDKLQELFDNMPKGNKWAHKASMIIGVFAKKDDDCAMGDREYFLFDTGFAVNNIMLKATEMDLVAHPIAGFKPKPCAKAMNIPDDYVLITLVIVGPKSDEINPVLSEDMQKAEKNRPPRRDLDEFVHHDTYKET